MIAVKNKSLCRYNKGKANVKELVSFNGTDINVYYNSEKARYIYSNASIKIKFEKRGFDIDADPDCTIIHISRGKNLPRKFIERYVSIIDPDSYLGRIKITVYTNGKKITKYEKTYEFHFITDEDRRRILEYLAIPRYNLVIAYRNGKIHSVEKSKATLKEHNQ